VQSNKAYPSVQAIGAGRWERGHDHDDRGHGHGHGHGHGGGGGHSDDDWTVRVRGGGEETLRWRLDATGQWYDFAVTCEGDSAFYRRFAGRVETGRHAVSDPAMGMADAF